MQYLLIRGIREGSLLAYVPSQKMLYTYKVQRNGIKEYICYQTILAVPKKRNEAGKHHPYCTARVRIFPDGICENMNVPHTHHDNHEAIVHDLNLRNNMKQKCRTLRDDHEEDARKIPTRHIYQREVSK